MNDLFRSRGARRFAVLTGMVALIGAVMPSAGAATSPSSALHQRPDRTPIMAALVGTPATTTGGPAPSSPAAAGAREAETMAGAGGPVADAGASGGRAVQFSGARATAAGVNRGTYVVS